MDIPLYIYKYLLGLSILVVLLFSSTQYFREGTTRLIKIALGWFTILMVANIVNMIVTLNHFEKNSRKLGVKGPKGRIGPKGFKGKSDTCGSICGAEGQDVCEENQRDENGKCQIIGNEIDDTGQPNLDNRIRPGKCIFPFVHRYQNRYLGSGCVTDNPPENYPDLVNFSENGWCATQLNKDKTARKIAYCGESNKEIAMENYNRAQAAEHDEFVKNNTGITDIRLISGNRSNIECPSGYTKVDKDLNEGSGGAYVYMCRKDGLSSKGVKGIRIAKGNEQCADLFSNPSSYMNIKKLKTDLNKDTNLDYQPERLFMCLGYSDSKFLTDVKVTNDLLGAGEGFDLINVNLNEDTDGTDLYLYTSNTRMEVNPLNTAFFYPKDKKIYFFGGPDGKYYYIYEPKNGKVTPAELIKNKFGLLPDGLDAAFVWNYDEKTYFFKGKFVYRYNYKTTSIDDGYPKSISREFPGVPNNIDAVFSWDKDNNTYFFKDKFLYKYDTDKKRVSNGYPRLIKARFPGAPDKVDAVYYNRNDNETYFVRANDYFILDSTEKVKDGYPQKLSLKYPGLGLLPTVNTFFTALGVNQTMYFFGNDKYYKYMADKLEEGVMINDKDNSEFQGIPSSFDCAMNTEENSIIVFFKGNKVYNYNLGSKDMVSGFPKEIDEVYPEIPNNLDACCLFEENVYFFKNNLVWKLKSALDDSNEIEDGFPKKISEEFPNMPSNIDTFTKYKDKYHVIKGIQFYIVKQDKSINLKSGSIEDSTNPNKYPQYLDTKFSKLNTAADRTNILNNAQGSQ